MQEVGVPYAVAAHRGAAGAAGARHGQIGWLYWPHTCDLTSSEQADKLHSLVEVPRRRERATSGRRPLCLLHVPHG